ncbi:MAG: ParA family protein [Clostridium sp.]|uniref:ParA family protein n=1 Tax=Clostridium sp. TaxID=1506 RepID=UPI0029071533|nr:ParA family protein [Clostridium sp.]MDU7250734.1 ParA family protein [Clostridium sp.]
MLNFKKGGLFSRNSDPEPQDLEPDNTAQVLAVWGSPGCGKTTVAVKLAKYLADRKKNVVLLLCDCTTPMLPCVCPSGELEGDHSLRSILAANSITESLVKNNCNTHKRMSHLAVIGLQKGENENCYPPVNERLLRELFQTFREMDSHIIIDCSSSIYFDELSTIAILEADAVLRIINCDLKSVSYLSSQQEYLRMAGFDFDKLYKAVSNVKSNEASQNMEQALGSAVFTLPHSPELEAQVLAGNLFADLSLKDSRGFRKEVQKISREVFGV